MTEYSYKIINPGYDPKKKIYQDPIQDLVSQLNEIVNNQAKEGWEYHDQLVFHTIIEGKTTQLNLLIFKKPKP